MKKGRSLLLVITLFFLQPVFSQETIVRPLETFSRIHISGTLDAVITKGEQESVKIVTRGINAARIISEVSDNDLHVYIEDGDYKNISVKVYITFRNLEAVDKSGTGTLDSPFGIDATEFSLSVSGPGNTAFGGKLKSSQLKISINGSGEVKLYSVETKTAEISVTGSGLFSILEGLAIKQSVQLSGSANISAPGFKTEECSASVTGSGSLELSVSKTLEATITGAGNLIYNGNPQITRKIITGTGKLARKS